MTTDFSPLHPKVENTAVEFSVEKESGTGKLKALNVTGPSGEALKPPPRKRGTRRKKELANGHDADEPRETKPRRKKEEKKPQDPPFYEDLEDSVKESLNERGFDLGSKNTLDVAFGDERVKLGQGKYAGLATASAVIAEGDYSWKANGTITFTWNRALKFEKDSWAKFDVSKLRATLSLADGTIDPTDLTMSSSMILNSPNVSQRKSLRSRLEKTLTHSGERANQTPRTR